MHKANQIKVAGEVLVRTSGHAAAARALNNSEKTVQEYYLYIEAGKLADQMDSAQRG